MEKQSTFFEPDSLESEIAPKVSEPFSLSKGLTFQDCEHDIELSNQLEKLSHYVKGQRLGLIEKNKWYKSAGYSSWDVYCRERWNLSGSHGHKLIKSAQVIENIKELSLTDDTLPTTQRQTWPLIGLEPEQQAQVWDEAVKTAPTEGVPGISITQDKKISGRHVQETVDRLYPPELPDPAQTDYLVPMEEVAFQVEEVIPNLKAKKSYVTISEWDELSDVDRQNLLRANGNKTFNKQDSDNIEWARWSWNPITGCLHNCDYCYARDIANRFYPQAFEPVLIPERLTAPANTTAPDLKKFDNPVDKMGWRNVFVCSMADLFGKWVPAKWIEAILEQAANNPQWTFLFLTKFPIRMSEFDYPENVWLGTSVDRQYAVERAEKAFKRINNVRVKWLSCEPMMERLTFTSLEMFDWVVIGGASRSTQTLEFRPPREWINHLEAQACAANCRIYEKTNLLERIREYPGKQFR